MKPLALALLLLTSLLSGGLAQSLRINEFLADNSSTTLKDEDGETPDWIEIHNPTGAPVSLDGLSLTDDAADLGKWRFPAVSIPAGGYLVVLASGKNRLPVNGALLHTSFVLAQAGEYLALVAADGTTILSEFGADGTFYPNQRAGVSYGYYGTPLQAGFLLRPTPGAANDASSAVLGFVEDTKFDVDRGFHPGPINVTITCDTPDAVIRYTTDGSWPSATVGTIYTRPVRIDRTLPLKAIAAKSGFVSSNVDTQTYIMVDNVVTQTASNTQSVWGFPSSWNGNATYYGMNGNPNVSPLSLQVRDGLIAVPTISIAMATNDLFGTAGIYSNPQSSGLSWERRMSLEFIDPAHPDGSNNFQQNGAIRIQGGAFRSFGLTRKKSFRVLFKSQFGPTNQPTEGPGSLDFPLFGPDAASQFQTLIFRMESNDGWQWDGAGGQPQYARDEFGRRAQLALGQPAAHGRYCHVYLNGVYWGVYNVAERPDSGFAESYFGATRETWQGQNSGNPINSATDLRDWNTMLGVVDDISAATTNALRDREYLEACGFHPDGAGTPARRVWIDPNNLADYLLVNWYGGNSDWPHKNYYCGRSRDANSTGFKFFMWDAEWSLLLRSNLSTDRTGDFSGVAAPQQHLERSPEYQVRFGDRAHRALFNDGVFTPGKAIALYEEITREHARFLNAEAARWGNQHGGQYDVRSWRSELRNLVSPTDGWFARRGANLIGQLRARKLYPNLAAPVFSQHGGSVLAGSGPTLRVPNNITRIYYQYGLQDADPTDYGHSLDPRLLGGGIHPAATLIDFGSPGNGLGVNTSAPLAVTGPGYLFARSYNSVTREWSALNTALFTVETVPANASNVVVSEIHYHPAAPTEAELGAGHADQDLFEFLEVQNIGGVNVDLSGVDFLEGIDFAFAPGFTLAAGGRAVIVKNLAAFSFRYPGFPQDRIAGVFQNDSNLRNSGETITIRAADGSIIKSFAYDDEAPWPTGPDGLTGASLVLMRPASNPDHALPGSWRPAFATGGNPAAGDALAFTGDPDADEDGDGVAAVFEHARGTSDQHAGDGQVLSFGQVSIETEGVLEEFFTLSFARDLRAEDVNLIPEVSADLIAWPAGEAGLVFVSEVPLEGTRNLVTYRVSVPRSVAEQLFVRLRVEGR